MKKIKVLYVITKGNFGGAQRYVFDLASNISRDRFEAVVALGEGKTLEKKLMEENIRTIRLKNSQRNINPIKDLLLFFELLKIYKKERPNIIHLNSSKIGLLGAIAARIFYAPHPKPYILIFTAHGWAFNDSKFFLTKFFWKSLQWLTVILSDKTIAVSKKTGLDMNWPGTSKKICVIRNGLTPIDFIEKTKARDLLSEKEIRLKNLPSDTIWIGTISELHKNKGLDLMINSLSEISQKFKPNWVFVVIGEGEERANLQKLIHLKALENKVFLLGTIPNAALYLKSFDIFTLTSRTEGLPYVILEAGSAGLPIVASAVGGIPEIIENRMGGFLFERENVRELESILSDVIKNHNQNTAIGENLRRKILEKFDFKNMLKLTEDTYFLKQK